LGEQTRSALFWQRVEGSKPLARVTLPLRVLTQFAGMVSAH
jgi:hypothetical protein